MSDSSYMVYTAGSGYKKWFCDLEEAAGHAVELVEQGEADEVYVGDDFGLVGIADETGYREHYESW